MINSVTIAGRLGQKPELKLVGSDQKEVTNLSVAVQGYGDKVHWVKCVAWGKTALFCCDYLEKGAWVVVNGRLEQESWEGEDGKRQSILKVTVENIESPKTTR